MKSLYFRVFLTTLYTIALSSFLGFYLSNVYYHWELKSYNDAKLSRSAGLIRSYVEQYPDSMGDYLRNTAALGYQMQVYDEAGNDIFYGGEFRVYDLEEEIKASVLSGAEYHGVAEFPNKPFVTGYFENRSSNSVGIPITAGPDRFALFLRQDARVQFDELRTFFMMMMVCTVLLSIPYFLLGTRYLVQPIARLTEATKRIAQGDYNLQLPTNRKDEIGQLAKHFHKMSKQLERSDKGKKEFVANVSHEIHTPLASIQGFADTLLDPDIDESQRRYYASVIGQEARHLAALSRQLLLLSTLDHADYEVEKRAVALLPQIRQALQLLEWQLRDKELAVRIRIPEQLQVYGDEVLLMQVWSNLLSNAVKHIPEGRSIEILASRAEQDCIVAISDTGDGIPEEHLPFLYDRFYRGDKARQRDSGSTGLGLSIVQKIVYLHGGTIELESASGQGTLFRVKIPGEV